MADDVIRWLPGDGGTGTSDGLLFLTVWDFFLRSLHLGIFCSKCKVLLLFQLWFFQVWKQVVVVFQDRNL